MTPYHAKFWAYELTRRAPADSVDRLATALVDAQVDLNPHQVDAALFAFRSPLAKGVLLADEVGLGKTIEAGLVIAQKWAERRVLAITPSNLRKQWHQELTEKFFLPCSIIESKPYNDDIKQGRFRPFERDSIVICFPSLCFALATGVGKTRLMGAFISYLRLAYGLQDFFVLAPNLTIYNKLIADFTPNTPKYVFKGVAEFATEPPTIITGENYDQTLLDQLTSCRVNIFNISKINSEVRGGKSPRIKRLSEYIGESYFDYLANLPDLVLIMDESHRYRASAGVKAINELKPILGLESRWPGGSTLQVIPV